MNQGTCKLNAVMCDHILTHTHTHNRLSHKLKAAQKEEENGRGKGKVKGARTKGFSICQNFIKWRTSHWQCV